MATYTARLSKSGRFGGAESTVKMAVWKELSTLRAVASSMHKDESPKKAKRSRVSAGARKK
jgi:hypothetical protein